MRWMPAALIVMACCWNAGWAADSSHAAELPTNDYPTVARADYVFGCMQVNGQTRDALERCSCSIDVIASLLPYDLYEEAETIMRVRQRGGHRRESQRCRGHDRGQFGGFLAWREAEQHDGL